MEVSKIVYEVIPFTVIMRINKSTRWQFKMSLRVLLIDVCISYRNTLLYLLIVYLKKIV